MARPTLVALLFFCIAAAAVPVHAITISDGAVFCESEDRSVFSASQCDVGLTADFRGDLANAPGGAQSLTFERSGAILGFVRDDAGQSDRFPDYANITLLEDAFVTVTLVAPDPGSDARFTFGPTIQADLAEQGPLSFKTFVAKGTYLFGLNATAPSNSVGIEDTSYRVDIAAVPLPAGLVLLMSGLSGLLALGRRGGSQA